MGRPKGSKNKPKGKVKKEKPVGVKLEEKVSEMDSHCPFRTCFVCGRESRNLLMVGPTRYRHSDGCEPGSANWCDYYERLREEDKPKNGHFLYDHVRGKK